MTATPVRSIAIPGVSGAVRTEQSVYRGFTVRETAGSTALVRLFDHASAASGTVLEEIALAANETARECYSGGVWAVLGIYVQIVSGSVSGSVRIG